MPDPEATILAVEDDGFLRRATAAYLEDSGFRVLQAADGTTGLALFQEQKPDLVFLDLRLPGIDGLELLKMMRGASEETPVIMVSGMGMFGDVVTALRLGAWDYITKPIADMEILVHAARNALEKARLHRENREHHEHLEREVAVRTRELESANRELETLRLRLEQENEYLREEIYSPAERGRFVGRSSQLERVLREIETVAPTDAHVLIAGETGTGKELVARSIHEKSRRRGRPLIKVSCASVPRDLFESEFFGHIKGAFTGALRDRIGRFQLAHEGTLFLDEIGEIPMELQGKLLRVLQEGELERVGEDSTRAVDVRVVAATNRNLEEEIRQGRFRGDLYYRIHVYPIYVPPLRERIEDIAPLAAHFLARAARSLGVAAPALTRRQILRLQAYPWPGNVRELQNAMERAVITSRGGPLRIDLSESGAAPTDETTAPARESGLLGEGENDVLTDAEMRLRERRNLLAALQKAGWKVSGPKGAARLLGLKPTTLASRMKALGIDRPGG